MPCTIWAHCEAALGLARRGPRHVTAIEAIFFSARPSRRSLCSRLAALNRAPMPVGLDEIKADTLYAQ